MIVVTMVAKPGPNHYIYQQNTSFETVKSLFKLHTEIKIKV